MQAPRWLRKHSLGIALSTLFVLMSVGTLVSGWFEFQAEQSDHGQPVAVWDFWRWWYFEYNMSLVADVFGAMILVFFSKWFWEKGSAESKDDDPDQDG